MSAVLTIKKTIKAILPYYIIQFLKRIALFFLRLFNSLGNNKQCYICKKTFFHFEKFGTIEFRDNVNLRKKYFNFNMIGSDINNCICPFCSCGDRVRHFFAYFDKLNLWPKENSRVLHFAPEKALSKKLESSNLLEYIKADLNPKTYVDERIVNGHICGGIKDVKKVDLMEIPFKDNYFDIVICTHVLEHVPDMQKGIAEIHRVLKNGGFAILQTPFSKLLHKHFEDSGIATDEQRTLFYGQHDHVRLVSEKQFLNDLENHGFKLDIVKHKDLFDSNFAKIYGVNSKEDLIRVAK